MAVISGARMEIKYHVVPGYITSKNDGEEHFISESQLVRLYGIKRNEYIVCADPTYCREQEIRHLHANYNGDYNLGEHNGKIS